MTIPCINNIHMAAACMYVCVHVEQHIIITLNYRTCSMVANDMAAVAMVTRHDNRVPHAAL